MIRKSNNKFGVSPVIGFLLIILIVSIFIAQYRLTVVPVQEEQSETSHFNDVKSDMNELRSEIVQSSTTGQIGVTQMNMGVDYDDVTMSITSFPEGGILLYEPADEDIVIDNAVNNKEASNYWRGTERTYETGFVSYDIDYNRFQANPELRIEHGLLYSEHVRSGDNSYILESPQSIIDGRDINLFTITGSISASTTDDMSIESEPVSAPSNTVSIEDDDDPITIDLPSEAPASVWENQFLDDEEYIEDISQVSDDAIQIELEQGNTYNLQMSRINLETEQQNTVESDIEPEYIAVESRNVNMREDSSKTLHAQVRDRFNNGVSGVQANVEAIDQNTGECYGDFEESDGGGSTDNCENENDFIQPGQDLSDRNGDVSFVYRAPESERDRDISFSYYLDD